MTTLLNTISDITFSTAASSNIDLMGIVNNIGSFNMQSNYFMIFLIVLLGIAIIGAVLMYNWWEEKKFNEQVESSFSSIGEDALLDENKQEFLNKFAATTGQLSDAPSDNSLPVIDDEFDDTQTIDDVYAELIQTIESRKREEAIIEDDEGVMIDHDVITALPDEPLAAPSEERIETELNAADEVLYIPEVEVEAAQTINVSPDHPEVVSADTIESNAEEVPPTQSKEEIKSIINEAFKTQYNSNYTPDSNAQSDEITIDGIDEAAPVAEESIAPTEMVEETDTFDKNTVETNDVVNDLNVDSFNADNDAAQSQGNIPSDNIAADGFTSVNTEVTNQSNTQIQPDIEGQPDGQAQSDIEITNETHLPNAAETETFKSALDEVIERNPDIEIHSNDSATDTIAEPNVPTFEPAPVEEAPQSIETPDVTKPTSPLEDSFESETTAYTPDQPLQDALTEDALPQDDAKLETTTQETPFNLNIPADTDTTTESNAEEAEPEIAPSDTQSHIPLRNQTTQPLENQGAEPALSEKTTAAAESLQDQASQANSAIFSDALPDTINRNIDLVGTFELPNGTNASFLLESFTQFYRDFDKPVMVYAQSTQHNWLLLNSASEADIRSVIEDNQATHLTASLQLADRNGPASKNTIQRFQNSFSAIAKGFNLEVNWRDHDDVLDKASALDAFCIDVDKTMFFHLMQRNTGPFTGIKLRGLVEGQGMELAEDGSFKYFNYQSTAVNDSQPKVPEFVMFNRDNHPFNDEMLRTSVIKAVTFQLDIPHVSASGSALDRMIIIAKGLEDSLSLSLVDDRNNRLSDAHIAKIREQIKSIHATMQLKGITPGSAHAQRLFS